MHTNTHEHHIYLVAIIVPIGENRYGLQHWMKALKAPIQNKIFAENGMIKDAASGKLFDG